MADQRAVAEMQMTLQRSYSFKALIPPHFSTGALMHPAAPYATLVTLGNGVGPHMYQSTSTGTATST